MTATYEIDRSKPNPYLGVAFPIGYTDAQKQFAVRAFKKKRERQVNANDKAR